MRAKIEHHAGNRRTNKTAEAIAFAEHGREIFARDFIHKPDREQTEDNSPPHGFKQIDNGMGKMG